MSAEDTKEITLSGNIWTQITDGTESAHIQESLHAGATAVSWCHSAAKPTDGAAASLLHVEKVFGPPLVVWLRALNGVVSVTKWKDA
ncbi:hypothetical protein EKL29_21265 [Pantoea sp. YU22]|uniref:hypothetical protein n=1 Tax=Pantoea sp. YU22 TaxID=2497684 RepID=UPI000F8689C8|nr:hypothetical protein [Pantoea sp. YU22]RTY53650.1 hypothetical protein EKL29_21265 [Pantoea sp. YU22]